MYASSPTGPWISHVSHIRASYQPCQEKVSGLTFVVLYNIMSHSHVRHTFNTTNFVVREWVAQANDGGVCCGGTYCCIYNLLQRCCNNDYCCDTSYKCCDSGCCPAWLMMLASWHTAGTRLAQLAHVTPPSPRWHWSSFTDYKYEVWPFRYSLEAHIPHKRRLAWPFAPHDKKTPASTTVPTMTST